MVTRNHGCDSQSSPRSCGPHEEKPGILNEGGLAPWCCALSDSTGRTRKRGGREGSSEIQGKGLRVFHFPANRNPSRVPVLESRT